MKDIVSLIESKGYNFLIDSLKTGVKIAINDNYPEIVLNHDKNKLKVAGLTTDDLQTIVESDTAKIVEYTKAKLIKYLNVETEQEYPKGEELDEDDKDVILKVSPFYKNFLNIYLIEFFLIKNRPEDLKSYLSAIRIPGAKKYAKELKEIYKKL